VLAQFGIEASRAAQYVIAFAIILVLVVLFGVVLRKLTGARLMMPGQDRARSRQPRLGVVDIYDLDRQRQLVLLRRDNVEHLLLIGGLNDVVIETNIVRVAGVRLPTTQNETGAERVEPAFEQAARPQVEAAARPSIETQLAAQLGAFIRRPTEESDVDQELTAVASVSAPIPARPEPVLKPDAVTLSPAPAVSLNIQGLRAEARSPVFQSAPSVPAPMTAPARPEPRPAYTPLSPVRPAQPPAPPAPSAGPEIVRAPQPAPAERPAPDAAILSDMAKQLEEALKRPAGPVPPPQVVSPPPQMASADEGVEDDDELLEPHLPPDRERIDSSEAIFEDEEEGPIQEPEPVARIEPPRAAVEPVRPAPPFQPAPPRSDSPEPVKGTQKAADPFSVEDIEAEFARLLGRPLDSGKKE
jgi:flagellar protein FliO/FliZ